MKKRQRNKNRKKLYKALLELGYPAQECFMQIKELVLPDLRGLSLHTATGKELDEICGITNIELPKNSIIKTESVTYV